MASLTLQIAEIKQPVTDVVTLRLEPCDRTQRLPTWDPGAHIGLHLGADGVRQYSLCGVTDDTDAYRIAVRRVEGGRGGSRAVHTSLAVGDHMEVDSPVNTFEMSRAPSYLFIAGGIGITPILPMIRKAEADGVEWQLLYRGRSRKAMLAADELVTAYGDRVRVLPTDEVGSLDLADILPDESPGRATYCCGPDRMLDAVTDAFRHRLAEQLVTERFTPAAARSDEADTGFDVEFAQSGKTLHVPADKSILEVAEAGGIPVEYSCREGTCGTCETDVLDGVVDHRDSILDPDEREANDCMFICVSRCKGPTLTLDR